MVIISLHTSSLVAKGYSQKTFVHLFLVGVEAGKLYLQRGKERNTFTLIVCDV